jgi:hypothetical protein
MPYRNISAEISDENMSQLTQKIKETGSSLPFRDFYYAVKRAAESGVPGCDTIAQDLGRRFAWASGKQEDKENKEEEPESPQEG